MKKLNLLAILVVAIGCFFVGSGFISAEKAAVEELEVYYSFTQSEINDVSSLFNDFGIITDIDVVEVQGAPELRIIGYTPQSTPLTQFQQINNCGTCHLPGPGCSSCIDGFEIGPLCAPCEPVSSAPGPQ